MSESLAVERRLSLEKHDRLAGLILLFVGLVTAVAAERLNMGSLRHPGPGFLPFILAVVFCLLAGALIWTNRRRGGETVAFWPGRSWLRPLLGVLAYFLYALLLDWLGFLATTGLFLAAWMKVIEKKGWGLVLGVAVGVTLSLWFIFGLALDVPLPMGFGL